MEIIYCSTGKNKKVHIIKNMNSTVSLCNRQVGIEYGSIMGIKRKIIHKPKKKDICKTCRYIRDSYEYV